MPYITEELWRQTDAGRAGMLMSSSWSAPDAALVDTGAEAEMDWVVRLISEVRSVRSEMRVPPGAKIPLLLKDAGDAARARLAAHGDLIRGLARLSAAGPADGDVPRGAVQIVLDEATVILPLADVIDVAKEKTRLEREMARLDGEIAKFDRKLANDGFLRKAPAEVIEEQRQRRADAAQARARLDQAHQRLAAL